MTMDDIRYSILLFLRQEHLGQQVKSVGEESIQTILDKCDVRYLTLIGDVRYLTLIGALGQGLRL
jgi:hypothetical protein